MYVGFVGVLAGFAFTGDESDAFYALYVLTLPAVFVMYLPIYLAAAMVDSALGYGLNGSPASVVTAVFGFAFAAALNVLLLRLVVLGVTTYLRRKSIRSAPNSP